MTTRLYN